MLVVTADDLGLDAASTAGVIKSLRDRLVSHASVIVNMPASAEAFDLVRQHRLEPRIGLHFNMSEGVPLTQAMRDSPYCMEGRFVHRHFLSGLRPLSADIERAVAEEVRAQIAAARSHGILLSHLDSHNNSHLEPNIRHIVAAVAREAGITRIRPARNCGVRQGFARLLLHRSYNTWLTRQGLRQVEHLGTVDDILWLAARGRLDTATPTEIMTHPVARPDGTVIDAPFGQPLAARLERLPPAWLSALPARLSH